MSDLTKLSTDRLIREMHRADCPYGEFMAIGEELAQRCIHAEAAVKYYAAILNGTWPSGTYIRSEQ